MAQWKIRESENESRIEITAKNHAFFWTLWLIFTSVFLFRSAYIFLSFKHQVLILLLIWGVAIAVFVILGIHGVIWSLTGKELLAMTPKGLAYERISWKVDNQRISAHLTDVISIEVLGPATFDSLRKRKIRVRLKNGSLRMGSDLEEYEANELVQIMNSKLGLLAR